MHDLGGARRQEERGARRTSAIPAARNQESQEPRARRSLVMLGARSQGGIRRRQEPGARRSQEQEGAWS
jgi:hypothetical protein